MKALLTWFICRFCKRHRWSRTGMWKVTYDRKQRHMRYENEYTCELCSKRKRVRLSKTAKWEQENLC